MAEENLVCLQVFLKHDAIAEALKFTVDALTATSYILMKKKLQTLFPHLKHSVNNISWIDDGGSEIMITSDVDLITALVSMNSRVKILYVTIMEHDTDPAFANEPEEQGTQSQVSRNCGVCKVIITGCHLKCFICSEIYLCGECAYQGHHFFHYMIRVPNTDVYVSKSEAKLPYDIPKPIVTARSEEQYPIESFCRFEIREYCGTEMEEPRNSAEPSCSTQGTEASLGPTTAYHINMHALEALPGVCSGPMLKGIDDEPQSEQTVNTEKSMDDASVDEDDPVATIQANVKKHPHNCDICEQLITGIYYRCLSCPKVYLCVNCEYQEHHSEHFMIRSLNTDVDLSKYAAEPHFNNRQRFETVTTADTDAHYAVESSNRLKLQNPNPSSGPQSKQSTTEKSGLYMNIIKNELKDFFGKSDEYTLIVVDPKPIETTTEGKENVLEGIPLDCEGATNESDSSRFQEKDEKLDSSCTYAMDKLLDAVAPNEDSQHSIPVEATKCENSTIGEGLLLLREMGFSHDDEYLISLLQRFDANIGLVIKALFDNP